MRKINAEKMRYKKKQAIVRQHTDGHVRALVGIGLGDGASLVSNGGLSDGQNASGALVLLGLLEVGLAGGSEKRQGLGSARGGLLGGGLLVLLGRQREHDELGTVLLQALSVQLQRLL